jgi:hypothetical protein
MAYIYQCSQCATFWLQPVGKVLEEVWKMPTHTTFQFFTCLFVPICGVENVDICISLLWCSHSMKGTSS